MSESLAKAYVQIIPTSQGLGDKLSELIGNEAESAGKSGGLKIGNALAKGIGLAGAAIGAASGAIGMLGKQAVESYADYEQLTGGVETLFETSAKAIHSYTENVGTQAFASMSDDVWKKLGQQVYDNAGAFKSLENDVGTSMDAIGDALNYGLGTASADISGYTAYLQEAWGLTAEDAQTMADAVTKTINSNIGDLDNYKNALSNIPDATEMVMDKAANAYKTAGLSANEYMETVTSFSAALIQSVGGDTVKAADMADMAITDMADNANKMGSSMESIQTAYQGFSKQNYTMLDNLKLGYGGTAAEMFRLLSDAAELNEEFAKTADFSLDSKGHLEAGYADIVQAIHIVQTEMGITGTTAKEASSTISGSIASMKASWANLITGIADDNADFDTLISNVVESAGIAFDNLIPRISIALEGIGSMITKIAPVIIEKLPGLASAILPQLLQSATSLVTSLAAVIPELVMILVQTIVTNLPSFINGIAEGLSAIFPQLEEVFTGLATMINSLFGWILENGDTIIFLVSTILGGFLAYKTVSGIFQALEVAQNAVAVAQGILNAVMSANPISIIVIAIGALVAAFAVLWNKSELFREFWYQTWENIKGAFETVWNVLSNFFTDTIPATIQRVIQFFTDLKTKITESVQQAVSNFTNFFSQLPGKIATTITNMINKVINFKNQFVQKAVESARGFFDGIVNGLASLPSRMWDIGSNIVQGIKNGISNAWNNMVSWFTGLFGDLVGIAKDILGIASPSKVFKQIGEYTVEGFDEGMENFGQGAMDDVQTAMDDIASIQPSIDPMALNGNIRTDYTVASTTTAPDINRKLDTLISLLSGGVNVTLEGDAQGLFRQVRKEVNQFTKSTGNSPFIAPA